MYVDRKAKLGEYIRHKKSGDIIQAIEVTEDGAVFVENVMSEYGDYVMDKFYWGAGTYLVMEGEGPP